MAKKKKNVKKYRLISYLLLFITICFIGLVLYLNVIPMKILLLFIPYFIVILLLIYKLNHKGVVLTKLILSFISVVIITVEVLISIYLIISINFIDNIFDNKKYSEVYEIYSLKYSSIKELNNKDIVVYENDEYASSALDKISDKIKFTSKKEASIESAIELVENEEADAFIINKNLIDLYKEQDKLNLKKIDKIVIDNNKDSEYSEVNVKKDSFVVYLSGIDTKGKIASSARSDVNVIIAVNPKSRKMLVINTPRDYYVDLATKKGKDKLTHAGIYGINESALTLSKLYDVPVNYYVRINFSSFVKIINTLGGITVDVEKPDYRYNLNIDCGYGYVCEQDSNREFGDSLIKFKYGKQTLDGEEALAYARNRYQYAMGDVARQKHQGEIIKGVVDKVASKTIVTKYPSLIKVLSNNIKTNIDKDTISKLVTVQLNSDNPWEIETMIPKGIDGMENAYSTGKYKVYVLKPDVESVNEIKNKIKEVMAS